MVNPRGRLLLILGIGLGLALSGCSPLAQESSPGAAASPQERPQPAQDSVGQVKSAFKQGSFPWYDSAIDGVRPVELRELPKPEPPSPSARWAWGDYLVFGGFVVALVILIVLVIRSWERFGPHGQAVAATTPRTSATVHVGEVLPLGLRIPAVTDDPWAEVNRRRLAGDFAGAVIFLFAHQLLSLSRRGLVRLAPGRTGRQLHRSVSDRELQTLMGPTLRMFEAVYYGHRQPTATEFAAVWTSAEAFERRVAEQVAR